MTDDVTENENIVDETIDNTSETDNNDLMNSVADCVYCED